jgi:hypothetical protein
VSRTVGGGHGRTNRQRTRRGFDALGPRSAWKREPFDYACSVSATSGPADRVPRQELSESQERAITAAMGDWAKRHPRPDQPVWGLAVAPAQLPGDLADDQAGEMLSPRELARAVELRTPAGERFLDGVRIALTEMPFDDYLRSINQSATRHRSIDALLETLDVSVIKMSRLIRRRG